MTKRTFGIWGCEHGHVRIFIEEMLALGHECAGIYEPRNTALAASIGDKLKLPILISRERLLQPDVDIIGSAAINNEKIDIMEQCRRHGKHIMVDKPAVTDRQGCERLQNIVASGDIEVGMLLTERFHPAIHTLKQWIDRGELGRLVSIGMRKPHRLNPAQRPPWFYSKVQSGGILIDLLIHDFDLLHWLTGDEIVETNGYVGKHILPEYAEFNDTVSLQVLMRSGLTAQLYADWHTPDRSWTWGDGRIFVTGTDGFAELRLSGDPSTLTETSASASAEGDAVVLVTGRKQEMTRIPLMKPERTITEDFVRRIDGKPSVIGHADIVAASLASIAADERVHLTAGKMG